MTGFDFQHRTRFVQGAGKIRDLGRLAKELSASRVLVVSDPGVVAAGHFERGRQSLLASGLEVTSFHGLRENPSTTDVGEGLLVAQEFRPDLLIGLGGGSSMDCAKGINFLYSGGGQMRDYWGVGKATSPMLPMIAVPTTAGTGSEAQSFALISDAETHTKMACGDPKAACRIALLDPELTVTQPPRVTALTGVDALTHAMESFVTTKRNSLSQTYSREAWRLLSDGFPRVLSDPTSLEARADVQWGSCLAGLAIETSMLGAAHSLANPLTSQFKIPHGQAVGLMMPHVIRWNGEVAGSMYLQLWHTIQHEVLTPADGVERLFHWFQSTVKHSGLQTHLRDLHIPENAMESLAEEAIKQWTANFNPRPLRLEDALSMYRQAY